MIDIKEEKSITVPGQGARKRGGSNIMTKQHQLAAVMFTDIVGYSSLMSKDESLALEVLQKNLEIHEKAVLNHNGSYIKNIGDGTLSIFKSSFDAVSCAIEIQENCCTEQDLQVRIGIHTGEVIIQDDDVLGDVVNIAFRIESSGVPGGIFISEKVFDDIRNKSHIAVEFIGVKRMKNIPNPMKVYSASSSEQSQSTSENVNRYIKEKEKSLIVMPFDNISQDPDLEYFSDGLTEEIITDLSHFNDLSLTSRSSAMTFKGTSKKITEIAFDMGVNYVLEGSVRISGNNVRITAQLIDAIKDIHLWAAKYNGTFDDIFDLQERVACNIAEEVANELCIKKKYNKSMKSIPGARLFEGIPQNQTTIWGRMKNTLERTMNYCLYGFDLFGKNEVLYSGIVLFLMVI
jgi:TolB-like protein